MMTNAVSKYIKDVLHMNSDDGIKNKISLTDGKSGAEVYRINITSRRQRESGIYIVKLINTKEKWYDPNNNEAVKGIDIIKEGGSFKKRLVELCSDSVIDEYHVLIYRQANDSILNTTALDKLKKSEQIEILNTLSYEILHNWNEKAQIKSGNMDYFDIMLSYRLEKGGSFEKKVRMLLENSDASAFCIKDKIYPNPLYYICRKKEWIEKIKSNVFLYGNVHGDLHRRNILCEKNLNNSNYYIIDYDSYSKEKFLLFDHAYLELSIYFDQMTSWDMAQWNEIIIPLLETKLYDDADGGIDEPVIYLRNQICKGISEWQSESFPHMKDDIEIQFALSRVAAGINYISKGAINEQEILLKLLQYTAICLQKLFNLICYDWETDNISRLIYDLSKDDFVDQLWDNCVKYTSHYTPILITDDSYEQKDYCRMEDLSRVKWSLVLDIGEHLSPHDFTTLISNKMANMSNLVLYNLNEQNTNIEYTPNSCVWLVAKKEEKIPYGYLWTHHSRIINNLFKQIISSYSLRPCLFVIDIRNGKAYAQKFVQCVLDYYEKLTGSRFIFLDKNVINEDDIKTIETLGFSYYSIKNGSLLNLAETLKAYLPAKFIQGNEIFLPTIDTLVSKALTEKEINYYETSVELVYSGVEGRNQDTDFGKSFYRGEEIKWADIANGCDLKLISNYSKKRETLLKAIQEDSPRVKTLKLIHGAGAGGTTLARRLLWDLKDEVPCVYLKKYTHDTANIILEIYRKTGKRVFLAVEMGSTIINGDNLNILLSKVNEANGKLLVLQIERSAQYKDVGEEKPFIKLHDTLQENIAQDFLNKFSSMTEDVDRQQLLKNITRDEGEWFEQRCPFFYGFYTFQEEYNLSYIERTILGSEQNIKDFLSDLALVTIYSQNICIQFQELSRRIEQKDENYPLYSLYEELDMAITKIIVTRDNGWRICHLLIAKKILCVIYNVDDFKKSVYEATKNYVERLHKIYGNDNSITDNVLKELVIDRSYIDSERTRFSNLIEDIPEYTKKKQLFEVLIDLFPRNPHYYNHLARLLVESHTNEYKLAIELLHKAINISEEDHLPPVVHYITLGCIYSKKIFANIKEEKYFQRKGRLTKSLSEMICDIRDEYNLANKAFDIARERTVKFNSYVYYPQIHMESVLIQKIVGYDPNKRPMLQIFENEDAFQKWYLEHYAKAVQLLTEMERHYEIFDIAYKDYLERAKGHINSINIKNFQIVKHLEKLKSMDGHDMNFYRRAYSLALYAQNGYSWNDVNENILRTIAESLHYNVLQSTRDNISQGDVHHWFEVFRKLPEFDASEAILFIKDYKAEGYEKEYLLALLHFMQVEKNISSSIEVESHFNRCKDMLPAGINSLAYRDVYISNAQGSPIVPYKDIKHNEHGSIIGLKDFYGSITAINGNKVGTIQIDGINLVAQFTPYMVDETGRTRIFTADSITERVKFNLMFSFSGLRAWNVDITT